MERFLIFCLDLFIAVFAYLLLPTILCICKKKFTLSQIKLIAIVNGVCVWLIFMIILINAGLSGTSYAVFLWSVVAYFLMKKYCLKTSDDNTPIEEKKSGKKCVVTKVKKTNLANTQAQKPKKKKQPLIFVVVALSILLVGSATYNVIQYTIIQKHTKSIEYLEENVLPSYIEEKSKPLFSEWSDAENNSFTDEFLSLREEAGDFIRVYDYKPETNRYVDEDGNEYRKQNTP